MTIVVLRYENVDIIRTFFSFVHTYLCMCGSEQKVCLLCECNAEDELMAEHVKTNQEAITARIRSSYI